MVKGTKRQTVGEKEEGTVGESERDMDKGTKSQWKRREKETT